MNIHQKNRKYQPIAGYSHCSCYIRYVTMFGNTVFTEIKIEMNKNYLIILLLFQDFKIILKKKHFLIARRIRAVKIKLFHTDHAQYTDVSITKNKGKPEFSVRNSRADIFSLLSIQYRSVLMARQPSSP